jgi:hypothetical protein
MTGAPVWVRVETGAAAWPCTLADFLADNADSLDYLEAEAIRRTVAAGCVYMGGGGAAAGWLLYPADRAARSLPCL